MNRSLRTFARMLAGAALATPGGGAAYAALLRSEHEAPIDPLPAPAPAASTSTTVLTPMPRTLPSGALLS
ncbi:MAG: hypothetical protein ACT4QG_11625 [Sporichthyaceae bacterium]